METENKLVVAWAREWRAMEAKTVITNNKSEFLLRGGLVRGSL